MKGLVIYSGDIGKASTKYRITQYADYLRQHGVELDFVPRKKMGWRLLTQLPEYAVVHNQRSLVNLLSSRAIVAKSRRVIFDFDDAIYTRPGEPYSQLIGWRVRSRLRYWIENAKVVTTANHLLADYARQFTSAVVVIPNAVDVEVWKPRPRLHDDRLVIGWVGAPVNIPNIEGLDAVLKALQQKYAFMRIAIYSGKRPNLSFPFDYHPFQHGREPEFVQSIDIGLLPLAEDEFSTGKSPIKAIQYLACGVPVVGNFTGATLEILNAHNSVAVQSADDWFNAIESLINDRIRLKTLAQAAREFAVKNHNLQDTARQRLALFLETTPIEITQTRGGEVRR